MAVVGPDGVLGRGTTIHRYPDVGVAAQPSGGAGFRVACGTIKSEALPEYDGSKQVYASSNTGTC